MRSGFNLLKKYPSDPILGLYARFVKDPRSAIYLGVGEVLDKDGVQPKFESIRRAEQLLFPNSETCKPYFPILGRPGFHQGLESLLIEQGFPAEFQAVQTCTPGGTGALALMSQMIQRMGGKRIVMPDSTWPNHPNIFGRHHQILTYSYINANGTLTDLSVIEDLDLKEGDFFLIQACCHNPTGIDPDLAYLENLASLLEKKGVVPVIDGAYLGLGTSLESDFSRILPFYHKFGDRLMVAVSFSKTMGLYGQRVGALISFCEGVDPEVIRSNLAVDCRSLWSNPPNVGAALAEKVLTDSELTAIWKRELSGFQNRITQIRSELASKVPAFSDQILSGKGLFCTLPIDSETLISEYGVYMVKLGKSSRFNVCALNHSNLEIVANAINRCSE